MIKANPVPDWRQVVVTLSDAVDDCYPRGADRRPLVRELAAHLARATTAWPLVIDRSVAAVDRRQEQILGPLYTSVAYPWPRSADGQWGEPLFQIALDAWGKLGGRYLGNGLLQSWEVNGKVITRVIPASSLADRPTPLPSENGDDYSMLMGAGSCLETCRPTWAVTPGSISGFGEPFFDAAPWHLWKLMHWISDPQYTGECEGSPAFVKRLRVILDEIDEPSFDDRHRAFGMCGGNVFETAEGLFLPPVVLTIEHDSHVFESSGSTLCLCVENHSDFVIHLFWE